MKTKKLLSQILLIMFLLMIALGFTIPVLDFDEQEYVEPRICKSDAECYLVCDDVPVKILCNRNICSQNSCNEENYYPFEETPVSFKFEVEGPKSDFSKNVRDLFIEYDEGMVKFYSSKLSINNLFEKIGFVNEDFTVNVNDEVAYSGKDYIPKEGDFVKVVVS